MTPLRAATIALSERLEEFVPDRLTRAVLALELARLALDAAATADEGADMTTGQDMDKERTQ